MTHRPLISVGLNFGGRYDSANMIHFSVNEIFWEPFLLLPEVPGEVCVVRHQYTNKINVSLFPVYPSHVITERQKECF